MKTAEYFTFIEWVCPYKTCGEVNEGYEPVGDDDITTCRKCKREVKLH